MSETIVMDSSNYLVGWKTGFIYKFQNYISMEAESSIGLSSISLLIYINLKSKIFDSYQLNGLKDGWKDGGYHRI